MMVRDENSSESLNIDERPKYEEEHNESDASSEFSDSDISDSDISDNEELEPLTVDDAADIWVDRLIELAVDTYQKKFIADAYDHAFKQEGIKDLSITEVYQKMDKFNQAKWSYLALYADFYKNFIPATLLSKSQIRNEAEQFFIDYPESNNAAGFQAFLQTMFDEKFKSELAGLILKFKSYSSDNTPDSSSYTSRATRKFSPFFFESESNVIEVITLCELKPPSGT